jgi:hypothetical protein
MLGDVLGAWLVLGTSLGLELGATLLLGTSLGAPLGWPLTARNGAWNAARCSAVTWTVTRRQTWTLRYTWGITWR